MCILLTFSFSANTLVSLWSALPLSYILIVDYRSAQKRKEADQVISDLDMTGSASFASCFHQLDFFFLNESMCFILVDGLPKCQKNSENAKQINICTNYKNSNNIHLNSNMFSISAQCFPSLQTKAGSFSIGRRQDGY